jgi:ankyrin repeat protein
VGFSLDLIGPDQAMSVHADPVEPILVAVLANDSSEIAAMAATTPSAIGQRVQQDILVTELPHMLYRGDTPLHLAAAGLRYDAARALLDAGTPVDAVNRRGATALHYACDPRPSSATWDPAAQRRIIELLVSRGAAVDQPDRGGVTALHRAVRARSPAAVAALLSAGADPRAATKKTGSTALHLAVAPTGASGTANTGELQLEIVRILLAAGATMTDVDRNGIAVVDRIQSQTLRKALAAGHS